MKARMIGMAERTWRRIGVDILTCLEEAGVDPIMTRDEVIEVVSDADHIMIHDVDSRAYEHWKSLTREEKMNVLAEAFSNIVYGRQDGQS